MYSLNIPFFFSAIGWSVTVILSSDRALMPNHIAKWRISEIPVCTRLWYIVSIILFTNISPAVYKKRVCMRASVTQT